MLRWLFCFARMAVAMPAGSLDSLVDEVAAASFNSDSFSSDKLDKLRAVGCLELSDNAPRSVVASASRVYAAGAAAGS